jgi:bifunctional polynucleotide phosphatase/kinase
MVILDGTLIKTKSGAVFPKDAHDWQLWSPKIVPTLQKLYEDGYKIVIFTNQRGIEVENLFRHDVFLF